jgi:hypothetical protein
MGGPNDGSGFHISTSTMRSPVHRLSRSEIKIRCTMTRFPERTLIAGLLAAVVVLAVGGVARARTGLDGIWSVSIITDSGACDRAYRFPLRIANGRVYQREGVLSFNISGHVQPNGRVVVTVGRGGQRADATGRLSGQRGQGSGAR